MIRNPYSILSLLMLMVLSGCQGDEDSTGAAMEGSSVNESVASASAAANVDDERLRNAADEGSQWMTYGRTYEETHHSPLDGINRDNVNRLGLAWFADYDTNLSQQGAPLYVDGVIYVSTAWSKVYAFDAKSGAELWKYDPKTRGEIVTKVCCGIVNRGIAAYQGKIYLGTLDGYLVAVDAASGKELWRKLTVDPDKQYSITSAPRIVKGKVLIGNSGSEFGVRGYLGAYDAQTGEDLWRFYTVPGNPELGFENDLMAAAAETWGGEWWKLGGGGTVWDAIVYDQENDLLFFGTGNGTPWNQLHRDPSGGDNLFIASLIAIKPDTGEYVWHYQTSPGDTWDYDAVAPIMLLDLEFNGESRKTVVQANKNGFMYVLDAVSGELLKADPFTAVNWAEGIDMSTGRPIEAPQARYADGKTFNIAPGVQGAHGWHANAYNPDTGLVYIAAQRAYFPLKTVSEFTPNERGANLGLDFSESFTYYQENPEAPREFVGYVSAWDPVAGKEIWRGVEGDGPTGGVLSTAGGVIFQGGGNNNNVFRAYDAVSGEVLWEMDTQTGVVAPPISFELEGKQYIALSVGINQAGNYFAPSHSRMLVFSLDSEAQLPPAEPFAPRPLNPPPLSASAEEVAAGGKHYGQFCAVCHGNNGQTRGANFPNLMVTPLLHVQEAFDQVVLGGVRSDKGMVSFADRLQAEESAQIRAFLIAQANLAKEEQPAPVLEEAQDAHADLTTEG